MEITMEARAFKSSCLVSEAALKPVNAQPLGLGEDNLFLSSAAALDDFSVDQFFDLDGLSEEEEEEENKSSSLSSSSSSLSLSLHDQIDEGSSFSGDFPCIDFPGSFSVADGLAIPAEDMKELELWSHLMDGALHEDIFACPASNPSFIPGPNRVHFEPKNKPALVDATRFPPPVLTRPRSKRPRSIAGSWSSSYLLEPESSFSTDERGLVRVNGPGLTKNTKKGVERMKKSSAAKEDGDSAVEPAQQRKCTHCQVQKTPQWRTGPLGPKTLCNACGVRFKTGRLFPEYRPACSPTFSSEVHSNSHRKVVEMRKRKMSEPTESGLAPTILSC
ncbi:hypothetical protein V2J09_016828 [Rumex salicifolius]